MGTVLFDTEPSLLIPLAKHFFKRLIITIRRNCKYDFFYFCITEIFLKKGSHHFRLLGKNSTSKRSRNQYIHVFTVTNIPYKPDSVLQRRLVIFLTEPSVFQQHRTVRRSTGYNVCHHMRSVITIEKKDILRIQRPIFV